MNTILLLFLSFVLVASAVENQWSFCTNKERMKILLFIYWLYPISADYFLHLVITTQEAYDKNIKA